MLESTYEFQQYNESFLRDLNEIEVINERVGRDVDRRIQQRIQRFGIDGKRILGIHIKVPLPKEPLPPPPKYEDPVVNVEDAVELESERADPGGFFLTEEGGYE